MHHFMDSISHVQPTAQEVKLFHEASRLGWMQARSFLMTQSPELCKRILAARRLYPEASILRDPLEDNPEYSQMIKSLYNSIEEELREKMTSKSKLGSEMANFREWPLGTCHLIWRRLKEELATQGLVWYSPAELNPTHAFD